MSLYTIHSAVRIIDPDNAEQLQALQQGQLSIAQLHGQTLQDKLYEPSLTHMPLYANAEYANAAYIKWAQKAVEERYPGAKLKYGIIDMILEPAHDPDADAVVVPAALITIVEYKGKKILGPLMAGLPGDMLTSKGRGYDEAKINLKEPYSSLFNAEQQGQFLGDVIENFLDMGKAHNNGKPRYDAVIIATPDIGTSDLTKRGSYRAFNGTNPATGDTLNPPRPRMNPVNYSSHKFNFYGFSDDAALRSELAAPEARQMFDFIRGLRQQHMREHDLPRPEKRLNPEHSANFLSLILSKTQTPDTHER